MVTTAMCNCLKQTETELRKKIEAGELSDLVPKKGAKLRFLMPKNGALLVRAGRTILNIPYEATWDMPEGSRKKTKDTQINMIASHCPFCGKAFEEEPSGAQG